jgi:hypothetical protein
LNLKKNARYLDGTINAGGHAKTLWEASGHTLRIVGFDQDGVGSIEVGDNIKVVLRLYTPVEDIDAERLWFKVTQINDGKLLAELDNDPLYIKSISGTDALEFNESNVLEVLKPDNKDDSSL